MIHSKTVTQSVEFSGQFSIADINSPCPGALVLSFPHGFIYLTGQAKSELAKEDPRHERIKQIESSLSVTEQTQLQSLLEKVFKEVSNREGYK